LGAAFLKRKAALFFMEYRRGRVKPGDTTYNDLRKLR
jgi:hypothetical protein